MAATKTAGKAAAIEESRPVHRKVFSNGYQVQMNKFGHLRIVTNDNRIGPWSGYAFIAQCPDGKYFACTAYYEGMFPVEQPFTITPVEP